MAHEDFLCTAPPLAPRARVCVCLYVYRSTDSSLTIHGSKGGLEGERLEDSWKKGDALALRPKVHAHFNSTREADNRKGREGRGGQGTSSPPRAGSCPLSAAAWRSILVERGRHGTLARRFDILTCAKLLRRGCTMTGSAATAAEIYGRMDDVLPGRTSNGCARAI